MNIVERVHLIRHGQTDWNVEGRWQGTLPTELNDEGHAQAAALASHMRSWPIQAVYTSDLPRAAQTAAALGETLGVSPILDSRWQEFHLGIFQGLTRDQIEARYPHEWHEFRRLYWEYVVPEGESRRMLQSRAFAAWSDIVARPNASEVAVVSHGGVIRMLLLKLFADHPDVPNIHIENTSITTIERRGDDWHLLRAALIPHLTV
ncbi:MAG: histidine phosphatase family protein [Anaerolineae bacterium]|nr:histidine phosphatase family protein [Anaerolineae bacterium]